MSRADLKPGEVLCQHCTAKCCRYFSLAIDRPSSAKDLDYFRWYLLHQHATIFTENDDWFLLVHTECKHLGENNMCGIYETRPQICRDYTTDQCEYEDDYTFDRYFETAEQVQDYSEARYQTVTNFRSPRPTLNVIN